MLFASASHIALVLTGPAVAAEWDLILGGYSEFFLGYVSYNSPTSSGFDGGDALNSTEIFVLPSLTLDNGIKFGADIQLEGHIGESNAGVEFDEASLYVTGSFGHFRLGKSDTAGNFMQFGAPQSLGPAVNFTGISSGSLLSFIPAENVHSNRRVGSEMYRGTLGSTYVSNTGEETHGRISYFTPRLAGVQLGFSYAHESASMGIANLDGRQKYFDIGANYINNFVGFDVAVSGKWGISDNKNDPDADPEYYGIGARLGYGGITVGGSWAESYGSSNALTDGQAYEVGASYETGPWAFSLNYLNGRNTDNEHPGLGFKERFEAVTLATRYHLAGPAGRSKRPLAPGQATTGFNSGYNTQNGIGAYALGYISYVDFREDIGDGGIGTPPDDIDGFVIGTGIELTF